MIRKPVKVLLIDDDEDDYIITRDLLSEEGEGEFQLDWSQSYQDGLEQLGKNAHDVYLIDYRLGPYDGLALFEKAHELGCEGITILLSGINSPVLNLEVMRAGGADYLAKDRLDAKQLRGTILEALERHASR